MKFDVLNRWTGQVQFSAEIEATEDTSWRIKVGLALQWGYRSDAVLSGADLRGADLSGADLSGADLSGADLSSAVLSGADLRDAVLSGAVLSGADLRDAVLSGADGKEHRIDGDFSIVDAGRPNRWLAFGYVDKENQTIRVRVGCRHFEIGEGQAYWSNPEHPHVADRREVLAALDYIKAVMVLRGWKAIKQRPQ